MLNKDTPQDTQIDVSTEGFIFSFPRLIMNGRVQTSFFFFFFYVLSHEDVRLMVRSHREKKEIRLSGER